LLDQQRLKREDVSEEEELQNDDVKMDGVDILPKKKKKAVKFESDDEDDDENDDGGLFVNPLLAGKSKAKKSTNDDSVSNDGDDESGSGFASADEADERAQQKQK
jgi:hypothetical protein